MKHLKKIIIAFILIFCVGILIAYNAMFVTYNKVNKEQAVIEVDYSGYKVLF